MKEWNVEICDVTLRDGEQTPGVTFSPEEKCTIARMLDETGVDCIEAGFPAVSPEEVLAVRRVSAEGLNARISCLARATIPDIDAALAADVSMVSIFLATSRLHIQCKFGIPRSDVLTGAMTVVEYAKDHGLSVRFAAEDASRTDLPFLLRVYKECETHHADMIGFSDTTGCLVPSETADLTREITRTCMLPLSIHCHNDLGCAVANTITAAANGAVQLHTCVNGIGERSGNAALDEVLTILHYKGGVDRYDLSRMPGLSAYVAKASGIPVAKSKPLTGTYAFSHESGIHVAAMLEDPATYEYIPPELLGRSRRFLLGKHSGRRAVEYVLRHQGYTPTTDQITWILRQIKERSERKCSVTLDTLRELIEVAAKLEK